VATSSRFFAFCRSQFTKIGDFLPLEMLLPPSTPPS
jgi:hypothetical protein